jgi:hypothetical protein
VLTFLIGLVQCTLVDFSILIESINTFYVIKEENIVGRVIYCRYDTILANVMFNLIEAAVLVAVGESSIALKTLGWKWSALTIRILTVENSF